MQRHILLHRNTRRRLDYARPRLWREFGELIAAIRDLDATQTRSLVSVPGTTSTIGDGFPAPRVWHIYPTSRLGPAFVRRSKLPVRDSAGRPSSRWGVVDPSGLVNVANFNAIADRLSMVSNERWSFQLTWWSQWHERVPRVSKRVEILRQCDEPWDLLCEVRALAVLTHLGFGFKTTIVDGLAAGCHVIVHPRLAPRLPKDIADLCIVCDPANDAHMARLAHTLSMRPAYHDVNRLLRERALAVLRTIVEN